MSHRFTAPKIFAAMLAAALAIGILVVAEGLYRYSLGGWPVYENGKISHGIYRRLGGLLLLTHTAVFFAVALRLRRPRRSILWLYPLAVITLLGGGIIALDVIWKEGGDFSRGAGFLAVPFAITILTLVLGTEKRETKGASQRATRSANPRPAAG